MVKNETAHKIIQIYFFFFSLWIHFSPFASNIVKGDFFLCWVLLSANYSSFWFCGPDSWLNRCTTAHCVCLCVRVCIMWGNKPAFTKLHYPKEFHHSRTNILMQGHRKFLYVPYVLFMCKLRRNLVLLMIYNVTDFHTSKTEHFNRRWCRFIIIRGKIEIDQKWWNTQDGNLRVK